jgi:hypothetical protein
MRAFLLLGLVGLVFSTGCSTDVFAPDAGDDGGSQGDGGPHDDGGSPEGSPDDATPDSPIVLEGGSGDATPADPGILCKGNGTAYCDPSNQVCCGDATWGSASCISSAGCSSIGSHTLECDDSADCGGIKKCCATVVVNTVTGSTCASSCSQYELCTDQSQCGGKSCAPISGAQPSWLSACQ